MRCPKCGAFMEQGKDICLMCGTNAKTYVPENNNSFSNNITHDGMFGSGTGMPTNNFNRNYNQPKADYRNVELAPVKNGERDMFDFFAENKRVIMLVVGVLLIAILAFAGFKYFEYKNKEVELEPVFRNLYFEIDESLQLVSSDNSSMTYNKTGNNGTECAIVIKIGSSLSEDHVEEWFNEVKTNLEPKLDSSGNVVNELDVFTEQQSSLTINNASWHYMNIFYKEKEDSEATHLKHKFLTSVYKGYFYNITLTNYKNDAACNASLDNFSRSLEFIDADVKS